MNINYIIYGSIGLGILILLTNLIDFSYWISKIFFTNTERQVKKTSKQSDFIEIVRLWYELKESCDRFNLTVASQKLDEVFPLLNGVLEDEVDA